MANKSVSIKDASDKELDELLVRLRKEREAQSLAMDIKRNSTPPDPLRPYDYLPVFASTEVPVESLYHNEAVQNTLAHFGVLGMKWGVRRSEKALAANKRDVADLRKHGFNKEADAVQKVGDKIKAKADAKADKVWEKSDNIRKLASDSLIKTTSSKEYEAAVIKAAKQLDKIGLTGMAREQAFQSSACKVINDMWANDQSTYSPSKSSRIIMSEVNVMGNIYLTPSVVKADSEVKHSALVDEEAPLYIFKEDGTVDELSRKEAESTVSHVYEDADDVLEHFGIPGMKWGVRRAVGPDGTVGGKGERRAIKKERKLDVKNRRQLSDKDLLEKIGRLEKEKKLRELTEAEIKPGKTYTKEILKSAGSKVATTVIAGAALYAVQAALTKKFNPADMAKNMFFKK